MEPEEPVQRFAGGCRPAAGVQLGKGWRAANVRLNEQGGRREKNRSLRYRVTNARVKYCRVNACQLIKLPRHRGRSNAVPCQFDHIGGDARLVKETCENYSSCQTHPTRQ